MEDLKDKIRDFEKNIFGEFLSRDLSFKMKEDQFSESLSKRPFLTSLRFYFEPSYMTRTVLSVPEDDQKDLALKSSLFFETMRLGVYFSIGGYLAGKYLF